MLNTCKQCEGTGRFIMPPLPGQSEPQVDEDCARCGGSGQEADAERLRRAEHKQYRRTAEREVERVLREYFGHLVGNDDYFRRAAREAVQTLLRAV